MINIEKLLRGKHITFRWCGPYRFHNMCGYGHCQSTSCKNCCHTNYYIVIEKKKREYRLPNYIQHILRKVWE